MTSLPLQLTSDDLRAEGIAAIDDLLNRLKIDHAFVGGVARSAWLGGRLDSGSIDVLALLPPERKNQVPMMASNRGFMVDRDAVEAADELDVIPLEWKSGNDSVRIHVLVASNALYAMMVNAAVDGRCGELPLRVASAEDLALMWIVGEEDESEFLVRRLIDEAGALFDRERLNEKLVSIGLRRKVISS